MAHRDSSGFLHAASVILLIVLGSCSNPDETSQQPQPSNAGATIQKLVAEEWIELGDGHRAYRAAPLDGGAPRVVLLHAWWGLNDTFRQLAVRLSEAGFLVVAPDLFDGLIAETVEEAEREVNRTPLLERMGPVDAALAYLREGTAPDAPGVGVVGFSLGAFYAAEAAAKEPAVRAVVLYYGTGRTLDWTESQASFQGHYAGDDPFEPADNVNAYAEGIRRAGHSFELHVYPDAGHWFMEQDRPAYDVNAAMPAWDRTVDFLRRSLSPPEG